MQVVITHDFFETFGGAERVTAEIAAAFPEASVHALLGRHRVAVRMGIEDRVSTVLPERTRLLTHYRALAPAYPALVRVARLPAADVIVASSYAYAHGFHSTKGAVKLCYSHGPFRHLWSQQSAYEARLPALAPVRLGFRAYTAIGRAADRAAAASVDHFLTQSPFTVDLIRRAYGREAEILPPPINCDLFTPAPEAPGDYFLFVGRLVEAYKRPSLVVEAFSRLPGQRLLIAGDGPALPELRRVATDNVEFLGALGDEDLVEAMRHCKAAIFPSVDDFGLVPLEVNACGRPVIAVRAGGPLHTVRPGFNGEFLAEQTSEAIVSAVSAFDSDRYDSEAIRDYAKQWDRHEFRQRVRTAAEQLLVGRSPS